MEQKEIIYSYDELSKAVELIYSLMSRYKVFAFIGDLGAGKTTLIRALLKKCGVTDTIVSPTYTYVSIYQNSKQEMFYHFDLYRIKELREFFDLGFEEYLYQDNSWAFIEWPDVIEPLLTKETCNIYLDYKDQNQRILKLICKD